MTFHDAHQHWLYQATYAAGLDFGCCYHSNEDAFHFFEMQYAQ